MDRSHLDRQQPLHRVPERDDVDDRRYEIALGCRDARPTTRLLSAPDENEVTSRGTADGL